MSMTLMTKQGIQKLIASTLNVNQSLITDDLGIGDIPEWDSLSHMRIIAAIESEIGQTLDIEQILEIEDVEDIYDTLLGNKEY